MDGEQNIKFIFVGEGAGVPGVPHEVTREEADQLGALKEFEAALERGLYVKAESLEMEKISPSRSAKKKAEVNNGQ